VLIGADAIAAAATEAGARPGDTRWVHSGLQRSGRIAGATRAEKLDTIVAGLGAGAAALWMPTFTYSFTQGEEYEPAATPSTVGLLTERFRLRPRARRTADPIFSAAVEGPAPEHLFAVRDQDCFGTESVFAHLAEVDALLVFFDVSFELCTFIHHVEQRLGVPYRYIKPFAGDIVVDGARTAVEARFFVRRLDEDVVAHLTPLWDSLAAAGLARTASIPRGPTLRAVRARAVAAHAAERVAAEPDFLLERGHR
jgi:aminoglycoside 3-N-acetyltransferase